MNLDLECSEMDFKIEPFGYEEKDNIYCELKFSFQTNAVDMIDLIKMYKKLNDIREDHWYEDENGESHYQTDIWKLNLEFIKFQEENI